MSENRFLEKNPDQRADTVKARPVPEKFPVSNIELTYTLEQQVSKLLERFDFLEKRRKEAISKIIATSIVDACADLAIPVPAVDITIDEDYDNEDDEADFDSQLHCQTETRDTLIT